MRVSSSLAARLDALSPLAVLGRGYAVCWNADGTSIIQRRDDRCEPATTVSVTLERGALHCDVRGSGLESTVCHDLAPRRSYVMARAEASARS